MSNIFLEIQNEIKSRGYDIIGYDFNRPWGGFLLINESQSEKFVNEFISDHIDKIDGRVSPKILIVNPNSKLSWQYHHRRKEIWKVFRNEVGVVRSMNDIENEIKVYKEGDLIQFENQERHRLIGLLKIGIVAEIWIHTDKNNPSNEEDIVRLKDDYFRD
ncbi:MAG: phosphoheptose isomerase [Flavobacteriaceae bacterium]|jgi:mannose-6-phosphate isomerase-like protein (cupin superfamily)|nr:phosphoheptose isomerase [Flavobacteriaceae bacterium]|tara:strand:+ start:12486 stop:12965 length:480 start_codon:yes stop_codon:yes gene_type:complete